MLGRLWVDILEGHHIFILVHDLTRYLTFCNFAEQAVIHRYSSSLCDEVLLEEAVICGFAANHCFLQKYFKNLLFCPIGIDCSSRRYLNCIINFMEGCVCLDRGNFALRLLFLLCFGLRRLLMRFTRLQPVQCRVVELGQIHFLADGFNGLVDKAGLKRELFRNLLMHTNSRYREKWLIGSSDLLKLFAATLVGLCFPPTGYMHLLTVLFNDLLDCSFRYAQLFGDLSANAIELSGYGQLGIACLNLGDLFRCGNKRLRRWNFFALRLGWLLWFGRFGFLRAGLASALSIRTPFTGSTRTRSAIRTSGHRLPLSWLCRIRYAHTTTHTIGRGAARAAIASRAAVVAVTTWTPVITRAIWRAIVTIIARSALVAIATLSPVVTWRGKRRE